jgi:integration host factor subunit alpha
MTLVKEGLIQSLYNQSQLSKHQSRVVAQTVFELIKKALESGDDVLISGYLKCIVRNMADRRGRNAHTGEDVTLKLRRVTTLKCSPVMRERINRKG